MADGTRAYHQCPVQSSTAWLYLCRAFDCLLRNGLLNRARRTTNAGSLFKRSCMPLNDERPGVLTGEKIASLVDEVLKEFKNDFMIAAVLQPRKELPVWKVVLTRHNPEPQERL